jgi:hypothetical protein
VFKKFLIPSKINRYYPYLIRKPALVFYTVFLILFNLLTPLLLPESFSQVAASSITANRLIALTNSERSNLGISTLRRDARLTSAAYAKAQNMLKEDYWDHFGPNGETPWQFIIGAGYSYQYAGENLGKGFSTSEGLHQAWMASPTHRANIVKDEFKDVGIAVVNGTLQGEETTLVVQMFGAQVNSKPKPAPTSPAKTRPSSTRGIVRQEIKEKEEGEIKSISINSPQDKSVHTNNKIGFKGEVELKGELRGAYTVKINEDSVKIKETKSTTEKWAFKKEFEFEDGNHTVSAVGEYNNKKVKDTVNFEVDTTPPNMQSKNTVAVYEFGGNYWELESYFDEEVGSVFVVVGDKKMPMKQEGKYTFTAQVLGEQVKNAESIKIVATDKLGNQSELEILNKFVKPIQSTNSVTSSTSQFEQFLNGISFKAKVNVLFGFALLSLIFVQVYHYQKIGKLHSRGGYLFTFGIWVIMIMLGVLMGSSGKIL